VLRSVGYDESLLILEIEFQTGNIYRYFEVPVGVRNALLWARSKGQYFDAHVKFVYRCEKLR